MFVRYLQDSINFSYFILVGHTYGVNFFLKIRFILGLPSAPRDLRYDYTWSVYAAENLAPFFTKKFPVKILHKKFLELMTNQEDIEYRKSSKDSATI